MSLWPLWLYLGTLAVVFAGAWWWQRDPREPPSVAAERQHHHDLVEQYADESLISYIGESRRQRLRRTQPGQHVRGVWARIR